MYMFITMTVVTVQLVSLNYVYNSNVLLIQVTSMTFK